LCLGVVDVEAFGVLLNDVDQEVWERSSSGIRVGRCRDPTTILKTTSDFRFFRDDDMTGLAYSGWSLEIDYLSSR
jgi:hypothetical protein